jgi:fatty-acyl-CoA synthase
LNPALLDAFERYRDRVALIYNGRQTTYADALDEVYRLAWALRAQGLRRGDGIAALTGNSPHAMLVHLAAQLIGCWYAALPLPVSPAEHARILRDSEAKALVLDPDIDSGLTAGTRASVVFSLGPSEFGEDLIALAAKEAPEPIRPQGRDDDLAELAYTGGSTSGHPKAACYTFGRMAAITEYWQNPRRQGAPEAAAFGSEPCRLLRYQPFSQVAGLSVVPALLNGGTIVLHDRFDASAVLRTIEHEHITILVVAPSRLYQLLDDPDLANTDTSSLRLLVYAGAPTTRTRLAQALNRFGPILSQSYGQTETRMISVLDPADHSRPELLGSAGRPRQGVEVEIRPADDRQAVAAGTVGEVCVRSPFTMTGYWRQPELSAKTIRDGWLHTGDLGYLDEDGYLYLVDRMHDVIMVNGYNCYSFEVEDTLASHPSVCSAAVIGLPDEWSGEAIHAAVVPRRGAQVTDDELRDLVREQRGRPFTPRTIHFLAEIPLTPLGKADKPAVRAELARRLGAR